MPIPSEESFSEALAKFAEMDREKRLQMRQAAQASAIPFSRGQCVRRLADLYEKSCAKHATDGAGKESSRLEAVLNRLETEWDLLAEKLEAVAETLSESTGGGSS